MMDKRMRAIFSILEYFEYADAEQWADALKSVAAYSPEVCYDLLMALSDEDSSRRHENPFKGVGEAGYNNRPVDIPPSEEERRAERIVSSWTFPDDEYSREVEWDIDTILRHRLGRQALEALRVFLCNSDETTVQHFVDSLMSADDLAERATVDIVIKPMTDLSMVRGNTGHFVIYTQKDDSQPILLQFLHQPSAVFYLMYLIDHVTRQHDSTSIELRRNCAMFIRLYCRVYDVNYQEAYNRFEQLLFRKNRHGETRAGRASDIIYDIRTKVGQAFTAYDESCRPYVMTACSHLAVNPVRIRFEDEAKNLLDYHFV